jgi:undecaprenyl-diphosphatase
LDILQSVVLGIVQGITEFLPISSTAHLILTPLFMGWKDPGLTFDVALHVGTFLAVAAYFREDLSQMIRAGFTSLRRPNFAEDPYQRLAWLTVIGCVPAGIVGILFEKSIETTLRSPYVIASTLAGVALLLLLAEFVGKRDRDVKHLTLRDALLIGIAQACALIPGVSRSGATMTMGMFSGLSREAAARFSFLLGVPIIFASCLFKLRDLPGAGLSSTELFAMGVGVATSALTGYFVIKFLLSFLQKRSMMVFIVYRLFVGGLVAYLAIRGLLTVVPHT